MKKSTIYLAIGHACFAFGLGLIYEPLVCIYFGLLLIIAGVCAEIKNDKQNTDMIEWRTDKSTGSIIVAKQTESFCGNNDYYEVLYYHKKYHYYYDVAGEEIPDGAIEKWALIEE